MQANGLCVNAVVSGLQDAAATTLAIARDAGADDARVELSQSETRTATVRNQLPTEKSFRLASAISITVFRAGRRAATSSSDLTRGGLERAVLAALDIAAVTAPDPAAGVADADQLAQRIVNLDLHHQLDASFDELVSYAQRAEAAAFAFDRSIRGSHGAGISTASGVSLVATSRGFSGSMPWSVHSISCAPVASSDSEMQAGFWGDSARAFDDLPAPEHVGAVAARLAVGAMAAKQIPTQQCAVLFEPTAALDLLDEFVAAASGDALWRSGSFLADRLGERLFPEHVEIREDPYLKRAMASRCFDFDGIAGLQRDVIGGGCLQGYFLDLYAARRLGMQSTGNGYGAHNLEIRSARTEESDDFDAMLKKLNRGLLVTEMIGGGVNRLTGGFSRAAKGFWVEDGAIRFPVSGVTLASNLNDMFHGLQAIGSDALTRGSARSGTWLIEAMKVGGS